ncbi:MAG: ATP synthase F0 subunit A [Elusimicrobia bacterium RIFCSPLOWO2_02_FULL_39_32]|nr:MAG: ATP synthase F0 subunit A [Elusimicrobia bacterium GWA2_38_7]OGR78458.1 MAG: ATP synthase F0 subunit A [Elusimicrobia bacterium RIFCSPHIGHO2_02_FULL_39_36]OGR92217.1 MAG: ATP synthase F0 subunit A [Elusimicrobia bacterium RIFCSPLOWO2_02_FULL_39_32]OGR99916.1 MAG: ATP synthase F0 subunit A [Elusimicrobia bacterium RIFCSPLOWO2_12_FULL_39_28]
MDFKTILEHHILDHSFKSLFFIGNVPLVLSKHLLMMWISSFLLISLFLFLKYGSAQASRRVKICIEAIVQFIRDEVVLPALGKEGKNYLHYFLTLFFFILVCNLLGLIPGAACPTGNIAVTATLSLCTFCLIHLAGIRQQGVKHYLKSIVPHGLPVWLLPLMIPVELIGFLTKTFALCIRLFMNMIAGHIVVLAFLGLIFIFGAINPWVGLSTAPFSIVMSLFIYLLELAIVVPLQAFIFTFLTALFVGAAIHPEH